MMLPIVLLIFVIQNYDRLSFNRTGIKKHSKICADPFQICLVK